MLKRAHGSSSVSIVQNARSYFSTPPTSREHCARHTSLERKYHWLTLHCQLPSIRRVHLHCSRHCGPLFSVTVLAPSRGGAEPDVSSTVTTSVCESCHSAP